LDSETWRRFLDEDEMSEWQPIETAPKEGEAILVYFQKWKSQYVVSWGSSFDGDGWWCLDNMLSAADASHWMPLPEPPK
jgi:hypothetical protein